MKRIFFVAVLAAGTMLGQSMDWNTLIGKRVVVQRTPLFEPGTFKQVSLDYAGKEATIIAVKPQAMPQMSPQMLARMSPQAKEVFNMATVIVQFDDGTKADTGRPIMASLLPNYFEVLANQPVAGTPLGSTSPTPSNSQPAIAPLPIAATKPADPDPSDLTPEEVQRAISGEGKDHWVNIEDMGLMAAQGNQVPSIQLFMPDAVLSIRSQSAKKQYVQYEPAAEDKKKALTIVAHGYAGKTISEGCTSITRIVLLSDTSGGVVKEAYLSEPLGETWRNGFGATSYCQALRTKFLLADVQTVKAAAPNGEFLVAVFAGTVNTKTYKIKKKHQSKLGL